MESRGMLIIRSGDTSILFRAALFDASGNPITTSSSLRIFHFVPATGDIETYDFNDDTFKTGAVTTPTTSTTHETGENGSFDTGIHQYRHSTLTDFEVGHKYVGYFTHANLPAPVVTEFQYGDLEGDQSTLIADSVWDEDIISSHGTVNTAGLLLRALNLTGRTFNPTLNSLLGVADTAGSTLAGQVWEELAASHNNANTMGELLNSAGGASSNPWDDPTASHTAVGSFGELVNALDLTGRTNVPTLDGLLGVPDVASNTIANTIWEANSTLFTANPIWAGNLLHALGFGIAGRTNTPTLHGLLGVADTVSADIAWTILDEIVDGSSHTTSNSVGQRITAIDVLTESGGSGDLSAIKTSTDKVDATAVSGSPVVDSIADKLNSALSVLSTSDRRVILAINLEESGLRIELAVEQQGVVQTTPWTRCQAQIFDEAGGIITGGNISIGEFGAIGTRGFFTFTRATHGVIAGKSFQMRVIIDDGPSQVNLMDTTLVFVVVQG